MTDTPPAPTPLDTYKATYAEMNKGQLPRLFNVFDPNNISTVLHNKKEIAIPLLQAALTYLQQG